GVMVLRRTDAESEEMAAAVRDARFIYLGGGSPLHLRSVLKDSLVWQAIVQAWDGGAVLAGSSAGAMVLCDPMVDPRGGAFTLGLGLVNTMTVIPHANTWSPEKAQRTFALAPKGVAVVALDEQTAILRSPEDGGHWRASGAGTATAWVDGHEVPLSSLDA
ncbi:MAG TPA: Type 1 glutamine amidotransferase-like domain-containing protein, partial [Acidimicrobiales bacterium]